VLDAAEGEVKKLDGRCIAIARNAALLGALAIEEDCEAVGGRL